jgi:hypothetical protein
MGYQQHWISSGSPIDGLPNYNNNGVCFGGVRFHDEEPYRLFYFSAGDAVKEHQIDTFMEELSKLFVFEWGFVPDGHEWYQVVNRKSAGPAYWVKVDDNQFDSHTHRLLLFTYLRIPQETPNGIIKSDLSLHSIACKALAHKSNPGAGAYTATSNGGHQLLYHSNADLTYEDVLFVLFQVLHNEISIHQSFTNAQTKKANQ